MRFLDKFLVNSFGCPLPNSSSLHILSETPAAMAGAIRRRLSWRRKIVVQKWRVWHGRALCCSAPGQGKLPWKTPIPNAPIIREQSNALWYNFAGINLSGSYAASHGRPCHGSPLGHFGDIVKLVEEWEAIS